MLMLSSAICIFLFGLMKSGLAFISAFFLLCFSSFAQDKCRSFEYQQQELSRNPMLQAGIEGVEKFLRNNIQTSNTITESAQASSGTIIKIPVVVHILYHFPSENISDAQVMSQIDALNRDFRKKNADTSKIPSYFKEFAADCQIEFVLATSDIKGRATNGIIHKYSPITSWDMTDKIKFSSEMGDDAWDSNSYLNIWVGNMKNLLGYSSVLGGPANKDGIVINTSAFGSSNSGGAYGLGRTAVHEVGHWLGLKHLWGDADCGDDGVEDTPKQSGYTVGCPTTVRTTCNNGPNGNMYMNYMDFTNDLCLSMFTNGQKTRMRKLFDAGGIRNGLLSSKGLNMPLIEQMSLPEKSPTWLHVKTFPNPATNSITIDMEYDGRWIGKEMMIVNMNGIVEMRQMITGRIQRIDISRLKPGVYYLKAEKEGSRILEKIVKM
jgi:hypothetical protein